MNKLVANIKANKALYARRAVIVIASAATIALVAYAVKTTGDADVDLAELVDAGSDLSA